MRFSRNEKRLPEICAITGAGKQAPDGRLDLSIRYGGGHGLVCEMVIAGTHFTAWCNEKAWCEWVAPVIPLPSFSECTTDLMHLINLSIAEDIGSDTRFILFSPENEPKQWSPVLSVSISERVLDLFLLEGDLQSLAALTKDWLPTPPAPDTVCMWGASLLLGWTQVRVSDLKRLSVGDGLISRHTADVMQGEVWLRLPQKGGYLISKNEMHFIVGREYLNMSNESAFSDLSVTETTVDDITIVVAIEIGEIQMPLSQLMSLQPGDCIEGKEVLYDEVNLLVAGKRIAHGHLIRTDEQWLVRVLSVNCNKSH